jgi:hypothetical protein
VIADPTYADVILDRLVSQRAPSRSRRPKPATPARQQNAEGLTEPPPNAKKLSASEVSNPGRHHVGTPGEIISECPGEFVGIRIWSFIRFKP